jgi:hypothetical protein
MVIGRRARFTDPDGKTEEHYRQAAEGRHFPAFFASAGEFDR